MPCPMILCITKDTDPLMFHPRWHKICNPHLNSPRNPKTHSLLQELVRASRSNSDIIFVGNLVNLDNLEINDNNSDLHPDQIN